MSNPNRKIFKYYGPYVAAYYNQFFNPNICHVCKSVDSGNLILCDQCCLISYCSEEHKTIHYPHHKNICAIIAQVLQVKPQQDTRRFNDWQQWIQSRKELMESIQEKLDDKMDRCTQQIILWTKSCYICHQQAELQVCQRCFSANYCDEHTNFFHAKHDGAKCDELLLSFNIDIKLISGNMIKISFEFLQFVNETSCFEEMLEFYMEYIITRRKRPVEWLAIDYVRSDHLSGPLTVYSVFKKQKEFHGLEYILEETFLVIHIIAPNIVEIDGLPAWEILLHLVPNIQKLTILMIGSELINYSDKYKLCQHCENKGKEFSYSFVRMLYYNYIRSEAYTIPCTILIFHAQLNEVDTCVKSFQAIADQKCPVILCAPSEKAINELKEITANLGIQTEPHMMGKNHFSGLAPHRDLESGDTYFHNEYLIIYKCLSDDSIDQFSSSGSDTYL